MQVSANGIAIEVDDQGPANGEPLLLIMGLGMQLTAWPDELVQLLITRGFRVIRFDNRDAGLSQGFDDRGTPNIAWQALRFGLHLGARSDYSLSDMAADSCGVLDALGLDSAHVCGASMGGMIAQRLAVRWPQRVRSLSLMMTSSGARRLPRPGWPVQKVMLSRPESARPEAVLAYLEKLLRVIGSPAFPPDPQRQRERLQAFVERAWRPQGTARQLVAVVADGDRSALLGQIVAPTAIIHGQADPLIPVAAAHDLAALIKAASLDVVPGMGHDLPLQLLPRFADAIALNARR